MNRGRRKLLVVASAVFLFAAAIVVIYVIPKEPEKPLVKVMSDHVDLQVRNVRLTEVGDSGMKWEIMADTARYLKKENLALFEKVTVKLVTKEGRTFVMTGDRGQANTESRDVELTGNVDIQSDSGDRFRTDRLRYVNSAKRIETDAAVAMANKGIQVNAVGMILSLEEKKVTLLSQVRANFTQIQGVKR